MTKKRHNKKLVWFLIFTLTFAYSYIWIPPVKAGDATNFKDTLSDSQPSTAANHTISFVNASTVDEDDTITFTFDSGFATGTVDYTDIDFTDDGIDLTLEADCAGTASSSASISGSVLTFTICAGDDGAIEASSVITVEIGTNATSETTGDQQFTNPSGTGVKDIDIGGTFGDTNTTKVAIVDGVSVTATVPSLLRFTISGVSGASCPITTSIDTTSTTVPFGTVDEDTFYDACQKIRIGTNAPDGYTVTVQETDQLTSGSDQIADGDCDGSCTDSTSAGWATAANSGFAYCMDEIGGSDGATTADAAWGTNGCSDGTPYYKTVADAGNSETAQDIMSSATKVTDQAHIEFRLSVAPDQAEGSYSTTIVYIATPQFD